MANPIPELQGSSYFYVKTLTFRNQLFHQYLLRGTSADDIERAKQAITQLWTSTVGYKATFATPVEDDGIKNNPYLIINGLAVCLSSSPPTDKIEYADLFSRAMANEPIKCSQGHVLERERAEFWSGHNNGMCLLGNHKIGHMIIDEELQWKIMDQLQFDQNNDPEYALKLIKFDKAMTKQEKDALEARANRNGDIARRQGEIIEKVAGQGIECAGKIIFKASFKQITEAGLKSQAKAMLINGGKEATKEAVQTLFETMLKEQAEALLKEQGKKITEKSLKNASEKCLLGKLPFISLGFGVIAGGYRAYKGDYLGAVGEMASGVCAFVPGYGTAISMGIDGLLLVKDVYRALEENQNALNELNSATDIDPSDAFRALGLDPDQPITKEDFDLHFKEIIKQVHPDKGPHGLGTEMTEITQSVLRHKETIYKNYKWRPAA